MMDRTAGLVKTISALIGRKTKEKWNGTLRFEIIVCNGGITRAKVHQEESIPSVGGGR